MAPPRRKAGKAAPAPEPAPKALEPLVAPLETTIAPNKPASSMAQTETGVFAVDQARLAFVRLKQAGEETNQALEASYKLASSGLTTLGSKAVEALKANSDHHFAFWQALMGLRSPAEVISLHSDYVVQHFASLKAQTSDLVATAQHIALEASQPLKTNLAKSLNPTL